MIEKRKTMKPLLIIALIFSLISIVLLIIIIIIVQNQSSLAIGDIKSLESSESFDYDPSPPPMLAEEPIFS